MGEQGVDMQQVMQAQAQVQEQMQAAQQELAKLHAARTRPLRSRPKSKPRSSKIEEFRAETERLTAYANIAKYDEESAIARMEHEAHVELEAHKIDTVRENNAANTELKRTQAAKKPSDGKPSTQATD
jgi:hypothetical protein